MERWQRQSANLKIEDRARKIKGRKHRRSRLDHDNVSTSAARGKTNEKRKNVRDGEIELAMAEGWHNFLPEHTHAVRPRSLPPDRVERRQPCCDSRQLNTSLLLVGQLHLIFGWYTLHQSRVANGHLEPHAVIWACLTGA
jgi:hypothetical protein